MMYTVVVLYRWCYDMCNAVLHGLCVFIHLFVCHDTVDAACCLHVVQVVCDEWVERCLKMQREERCLDSKVRG